MSEDKALVRKKYLNIRKALSTEQICELSNKCFNNLLKIPKFTKSNTVLVYMDYNKEVETRLVIDYCINNKIKIAAPKVINNNMEFYYFSEGEQFVSGAYGIKEPSNKNAYEHEEAVVIMPGAVFDINRNRIGYGGGYYDRYLEQYKNIYKIALAYDFQIADTIITEKFDIKPDIIVSDKRII